MTEAMFTLCGQVANVFEQPGGVSKKTGEAFDPRDKVQIMGHLSLPNGQSRFELLTLNTEDAAIFREVLGKKVRIPVGFYASGKSVAYFIPRGSKPLPISA